jgi:calcium/calmodulin-dependent protein kinase I
VAILKTMQHPHIVHMIDFYDESTQYLIAMEVLEGGELFDRIVKKAFYNEKEARDLVFIMLSAVKYMHDRNVVHRDLKPENLLLKSHSDDAEIKIADFGFAVIASGDTLTEQCGTPGYVAPEILGHRKYGKSVDMWSAGVITYILLGGYPPFHDDNQRNLFKKIQAASYEFHPDFWVAVITMLIILWGCYYICHLGRSV